MTVACGALWPPSEDATLAVFGRMGESLVRHAAVAETIATSNSQPPASLMACSTLSSPIMNPAWARGPVSSREGLPVKEVTSFALVR
jgi:hypothetical protein